MTAPEATVCLIVGPGHGGLTRANLDPDRAHEYARNIGGVVAELPITADYRDHPGPVMSDPDTEQAERANLDSAMHSVWLHGKWRWLTQNMTSEEREAAVRAIERHWAATDLATGDPIPHSNLRWWDE